MDEFRRMTPEEEQQDGLQDVKRLIKQLINKDYLELYKVGFIRI